jgi:ABC-2 type transport system ATP-binding protein
MDEVPHVVQTGSPPELSVAVSVEQVSKDYPSRLFSAGKPGALRDISFTVGEGETIGLLGPNGAGKTTLIKIIATLLYPTSGRVMLYGRNVRQDGLWSRRQMGFVTCDERSFYWRLTARQNLEFFADLYGIPRTTARRRIGELLEMLGLTEFADHLFLGFSAGMKQKLSIARGLLSDPRLVLLDEPTRSLDPLSASTIRKWLKAHHRQQPQQTNILATNLLNEAEQLCDRVLIINRGRIIAAGRIAEIRARWMRSAYSVYRVDFSGQLAPGAVSPAPASGLLDVQLASPNGASGALTLHVRTGSAGLSVALDTLLRTGCRIVNCEAEEVPFDDVFCSLVAAEPDLTQSPGVSA